MRYSFKAEEGKAGFVENGSERLITSSINNAIFAGYVDFESRRGLVRMATMLLAGRSGVREPVRTRTSPKIFRPALEPIQPPIQWVPGFFPGVKADGA
jgi:hypothetical protein